MFVDLVILGLIFTSGVLSQGRRFTGELCSLLKWACALGLFYFVYLHWGQIFAAFFDARQGMLLLLAGGIFLLFFAVFFVLTGMLSRTLRRYVGARPDRILGLLYGVTRGVVIVCVVLGFFKVYAKTDSLPEQITQSVTVPYLLPLTDWAWRYLNGAHLGGQVL